VNIDGQAHLWWVSAPASKSRNEKNELQINPFLTLKQRCTSNASVSIKWEQTGKHWLRPGDTVVGKSCLTSSLWSRLFMCVCLVCECTWTDSQSKNEADNGGDEDEDLIEHGRLCPVNCTMKIILGAIEKKMMELYYSFDLTVSLMPSSTGRQIVKIKFLQYANSITNKCLYFLQNRYSQPCFPKHVLPASSSETQGWRGSVEEYKKSVTTKTTH